MMPVTASPKQPTTLFPVFRSCRSANGRNFALCLVPIVRQKKSATDGIQILRQVAVAAGVTVGDIQGPNRSRPIVMIRHFAMWLIRRETNLSLTQIGRLFNLDHTSVLYGINRWENHWSKLNERANPTID